jgi:cobalt-zinc-cadmium resistance protein CzcA
MSQVMQAIANSNSNVGANYLELGVQSYNVRGIGLFQGNGDIESVAVAARNGIPVYIKQLGEVSIGAKTPLGRVGKEDDPDIVEGIVLMRRGEQSLPTLERVRSRVEEINRMTCRPVADRSLLRSHRADRHHDADCDAHADRRHGPGGINPDRISRELRAALIVSLTIPLSLLLRSFLW